ncbi:hypothetical protein Pint_34737 [Pistacia integerrima]|uniref:Uncharacterized protein n=1 Tax=Pistacia integerrima TaxID=434235 RepID=A0ACC0X591_9ROSI|nr:hypothetical protein Pint_34737 [Pistacia integerrima]
MELKEVLHMNGGEGETSYANNSLIQKEAMLIPFVYHPLLQADFRRYSILIVLLLSRHRPTLLLLSFTFLFRSDSVVLVCTFCLVDKKIEECLIAMNEAGIFPLVCDWTGTRTSFPRGAGTEIPHHHPDSGVGEW